MLSLSPFSFFFPSYQFQSKQKPPKKKKHV